MRWKLAIAALGLVVVARAFARYLDAAAEWERSDPGYDYSLGLR